MINRHAGRANDATLARRFAWRNRPSTRCTVGNTSFHSKRKHYDAKRGYALQRNNPSLVRTRVVPCHIRPAWPSKRYGAVASRGGTDPRGPFLLPADDREGRNDGRSP